MKILYPEKPLLFRLSKLIVHSQFVWWLGHISVVFSTLFYFLSQFSGSEVSSVYYYRIFRGSVLSYGIVVWKGHQPFNLSYGYLLKILKEETTYYFLLSFYWWLASPVIVSVVPFFVFSLFHCVNYLRTRLYPAVLPSSAEELQKFLDSEDTETPLSPSTLPSEAKLFHQLQLVTIKYYPLAMKFILLYEVTVVPVVLFLGLFINVRLFTCFIYGQFLYRRAGQPGQTHNAFKEVDAFLQKQLENPSVPVPIKSGYINFRNFVINSLA